MEIQEAKANYIDIILSYRKTIYFIIFVVCLVAIYYFLIKIPYSEGTVIPGNPVRESEV